MYSFYCLVISMFNGYREEDMIGLVDFSLCWHTVNPGSLQIFKIVLHLICIFKSNRVHIT